MDAADQANISAGRAQDWITTVVNPILDGVRRELRFLPGGPWRWIPATRNFEHFLAAKDYVEFLYLDNYEDFTEKHPNFRGEFDIHDELLAKFGKEFEHGFELLSKELAGELATVPMDLRPWFISYLVGHFERLPDYYTGHELYQQLAPRLLALSGATLRREQVNVPELARQLGECDQRLVAQLINLRRDLADRHGVRVRPSSAA